MVVVAVLAGAALAQAGSPQATATLSSSRAGVRPVTVKLTFDTVYVCGVPRGVSVVFPQGESLPARIAPAAVRVNGKAATKSEVSGGAVAVSSSTPGTVTCDSLRLGTEVLVFTPAARLGNPRAAGRYAIAIRRGTTTLRAPVTITR